ncbi:MAG: hypothetical protein EA379_09775 [Phycisphaerales bacterium]|nr:MAG: hypothetical protein EA379_09775 [Phycisphaerales bacterium]
MGLQIASAAVTATLRLFDHEIRVTACEHCRLGGMTRAERDAMTTSIDENFRQMIEKREEIMKQLESKVQDRAAPDVVAPDRE